MKRSLTALIAGSLLAVSFAVFAAGGAIEGVEKQPVNFSAIAMFMICWNRRLLFDAIDAFSNEIFFCPYIRFRSCSSVVMPRSAPSAIIW